MDVNEDVLRARVMLARAPRTQLDPQREDTYVADLRDVGYIPALSEAAKRKGIGFIVHVPGLDGRTKVFCQGLPWQVKAFMEVWGPLHRIEDIFGDPARGFAEGYLA